MIVCFWTAVFNTLLGVVAFSVVPVTPAGSCTQRFNCSCENVAGFGLNVSCRIQDSDLEELITELPRETAILSLVKTNLTRFPVFHAQLVLLKILDLRGNSISNVNSSFRAKGITIRLDDNPLHCDCAVHNLFNGANNVTGTCDTPDDLTELQVSTAKLLLSCVLCESSISMLSPTPIAYVPTHTVSCATVYCVNTYIMAIQPLTIFGIPPYTPKNQTSPSYQGAQQTYSYRLQMCVPEPIIECSDVCSFGPNRYNIQEQVIFCKATCCITDRCNRNPHEVKCLFTLELLDPYHPVYTPSIQICPGTHSCSTEYVKSKRPLIAAPKLTTGSGPYTYRYRHCSPNTTCNGFCGVTFNNATPDSSFQCHKQCCSGDVCNTKTLECYSPWKAYDKSCYLYQITKTSLTWPQSAQDCQDKASLLVAIQDKAEWEYVRSRPTRQNLYYIGVRGGDQEGQWYYPDGTNATFLPWETGKADQSSKCVAMNGSIGLYSQVGCTKSPVGETRFICERLIFPVHYTHMGCYADMYTPRAVPEFVGSSVPNNPRDTCANKVRQKGAQYQCFSLQTGGECWTGLNLQDPNNGFARYGPSDKCVNGLGGPMANDVYCFNWSYKHTGCYSDKSTERALPEFVSPSVQNNAIVKCANNVRLKGTKYQCFGLQNGDCWAGLNAHDPISGYARYGVSGGCLGGTGGPLANDVYCFKDLHHEIVKNRCLIGNHSCQQRCIPLEFGHRCDCYSGYKLANGSTNCEDVNECSNSQPCSHSCINTVGGYICTCPVGYTIDTKDRRTCIDVNECISGAHNCRQRCINFNGGYLCDCFAGYLFNNASNTCIDIDECSLYNQCSQICINTVGAYNCSCQTGFKLASDSKNCLDVNECTTDSHQCNQTCNNMIGSYSCSCEIGFELGADGKSCSDINECEINADQCNQTCNNMIGSYSCSCETGFELGADGKSCADIDECEINADQCNQTCNNMIGNYSCSCEIGFELRADGKSCSDINECEINADQCNQTCNNMIGSYSCSCGIGFELGADGKSCLDINECEINADQCNQTCNNMIGSYSCSCQIGFELGADGKSCSDINECEINVDQCNQTCNNMIGSYSCSCEIGFQLGADGKSCSDINECEINADQCNQTCNNMIGSYSCSCQIGFELGADGTSCSDINECEINADQCNQTCNNMIGSYSCSCGIGFELGADGKSCLDINECEINADQCNQTCNNMIGSYSCSCQTGFKLGKDGKSCLDVDECSSGLHDCNQTCTNSIGSYSCSCKTGFRLATDWKGCLDIDECGTNSHLCNQTCKNTIGSYSCSCKTGFTLSKDLKGCLDLDECGTYSHQCNQTCTNTIGSYTCSCKTGFTLTKDMKGCLDVDECMGSRVNVCDQRCINTHGSYQCSCFTGYQFGTDNVTCQDVDECKTNSHACTQICMNTLGSYGCDCYHGYKMEYVGNSLSCVDVNECIDKALHNCSQVCRNLDGAYNCSCYHGYRLGNDKQNCADIDECKEQTHGCNQTCSNTIGSYNCSCLEGFLLQEDGISCGDEDECHTRKIQCQQLCNNSWGSYNCSCFPGFKLANKTYCHDVDECRTGQHNCSHSCLNTFGSHKCFCDDGFTLADDNATCLDSSGSGSGSGPYYPSCKAGFQLANDFKTCVDLDECITSTHNCSQKCNNFVGSYNCSCYVGFRLTKDRLSCNDIDECREQTHGCNQTCTNTVGSYNCSCYHGYRLGNDKQSCADMDECKEKTNGCNQTCSNTIGSYNCSCYYGYRLGNDKQSCADIDECKEQTHGCNQTCTNTIGSYNCSCYYGYRLGNNKQSCADIDECKEQTHGCNQTCTNTIGSYNCSCYHGYRLGDDKQSCADIDECKEQTHGCNQTCTNTIGSYNCSCYYGYRLGNDKQSCADIDECKEQTHGCNQTCTNTIGSYNCSCYRGYRLGDDKQSCADIDECKEQTHGCNQTCTNTIGSYNCSCYYGYRLRNDKQSCADIDECKEQTHGCHQTCSNTIGSYNCSCYHGYRLRNDKQSCADIDECKEQTHGCNQTCSNTIGSYSCSCYHGYRLGNDKQSCADIDECKEQTHGCNQTCTNTIGSYNCSCYHGYRLGNDKQSCADIDECKVQIHRCKQTCINTIGSYNCSCYHGYRLGNDKQSCADIDECKEQTHGCNQTCTNTIGSYNCSCYHGYRLCDDKQSCADIDECKEQTHGCNQTCTNTIGSYNCSCYHGYRLGDDKQTCADIDECKEQTHGCNQTCTNTIGSYNCSCYYGYRLGNNKQSCADIDECKEQTHGCNQTCTNTIGSYNCSCYHGYRLGDDKQSCADIDECKEQTHGCNQTCTNTIGSYNCSCYYGYRLGNDKQSCADIDECKEQTHGCNQTCTNTIGSYNCSCYRGYRLGDDKQSCADIDECKEQTHGCNQTCTNTIGSYNCSCYYGYRLRNDKQSCADIDECKEQTHGCHQTCSNTIGSYNCSCYHGYRLRNDKQSCADIDECKEQTHGCNQTCSNTIGSYSCSCYHGYRLGNDKQSCADIDECKEQTHGCNQTCTNTIGSYNCSCYHGYRLGNDKQSCADIDECKVQIHRCKQTCINTIGSYNCSCYHGYRLGNDKQSCADIDECKEQTHGCNQTCTNTIGSYNCSCYHGYRLGYANDSKSCVDLDECITRTHNCSQKCNNFVGSYNCSCYAGFRLTKDGLSCNDIDECREHTHSCSELCSNTIGSYSCSCNKGFTLDKDNVTCKDVDECTVGSDQCSQTCSNTPGSYKCLCRYPGYLLADDQVSCLDADECSTGIHKCQHGCNNTDGSYTCTCTSGYILASDKQSCFDLDECAQGNHRCSDICVNTVGGYNCSCYFGYKLTNDSRTCEDVDECQGGLHGCVGARCVNLPGSFICEDQKAPDRLPIPVIVGTRNLSSTSIAIYWTSLLTDPHKHDVGIVPYARDTNVTIIPERRGHSLIIWDLRPLTLYSVFVRVASNDGRVGDWSRAATVSTDEEAITTRVTNLRATYIDASTLAFTWSAVSPIEPGARVLGYQVIYGVFNETSGCSQNTTTFNAPTTDDVITIRSLSEDTVYIATMAYYSRKGTGPYSQPLIARTLIDNPCVPSNPCYNGGSCQFANKRITTQQEEDKEYTCACRQGYTGSRCESLAAEQCSSPTVTLPNIASRLPEATRILRSKSYTISSSATLNCQAAYQTVFTWKLYKENSSSPLLQPTGVPSFRIRRRKLQYGTYKVLLNVQMKGLDVSGESTGYIEIYRGRLVAIIKGGTKVKRGSKYYNTLDASASYDTDTGTSQGLTYTWLCRNSTESFPSNALLYPLVRPPTALLYVNGSFYPYENGGCYGTGAGRLHGNGSIITLEASKMLAGYTYYVTVVVRKGNRRAEYTQEIEIVDGEAPEVLIRCVDNCATRANPSRRLVLVSECTTFSCVGFTRYIWSAYYYNKTSQTKITNLVSLLNTDIRGKTFVTKPNVLEKGQRVRITLTVSNKKGVTGVSQYTLTTNASPEGGTCHVQPTRGFTLKTRFRFQCTDWSDPDQPLKYFFYYVTPAGKLSVLRSGSSSFALQLPVGDKTNNFRLDVRVRVTDAIGTYTEVRIPVMVRKPTFASGVLRQAVKLTSGRNSTLTSLVQAGNVQEAVRLAKNVLLIIKDTERNETQEDIKQQIEIKSQIVEQVSQVKVQSVADIRDTAEVISDATTSIHSINTKAQKSVTVALSDMTDVLTQEASDETEFETLVEGAQGLVTSIGNVLRITSHNADPNKGTTSTHSTNTSVTLETHKEGERAESEELSKELIVAVARVGKAILSKKVVGEKPTSLSGSSSSLLLLREEPALLAGKTLQQRNASFRMPNESNVFGNGTQYVDSQMFVSEYPLYSWDQTAQRVSTSVTGIENKDNHGNNITLSNLPSPVEITMPLLPENKVTYNDTIYTTRSGSPTFHTFTVDYTNMSLQIKVTPLEGDASVRLAMRLNRRPTFDGQDFLIDLPRKTHCTSTDADCEINRCAFVVGPPRIAIPGRYFMGVQLNGTNMTSLNYTIAAVASACIFWNVEQGRWIPDGCEMGPQTTSSSVHCRCSHLTSFSGQLYVLPNPIDFDQVFFEFTRLHETGNVVVMVALGVVFALYLIVLIWARRQDKRDLLKVGMKPFIGSYSKHSHHYHLSVATGIWRNAGTSANVYVVLIGELGTSKPIQLRNQSCVPFARGNTDTFTISLPHTLGEIKSIRIWHDNSGENPSWFLENIIIFDATDTGSTSVFFFQQWLAVEKGAGFVDRTRRACTEEELQDFKMSFNSRLYHELFNGHLWISVLARSPTNVFTRVQRVTCCLSLLLTMTLANAMFYQFAPQADQNSDTTIKLGALRLELRQLIVAAESALVVAPVNFIIVMIFNNIKPRPQENKVQKKYSVNRRHSRPEILGTPDALRTQKKTKCSCLLPGCFVYIGYVLCFLASMTSATFVVFYSLMWGREVATQWLISMLMSISIDILVSKPLNLLVILVFVVLLCRRKVEVNQDISEKGTVFDFEDVELDLASGREDLDNYSCHDILDDDKKDVSVPTPPTRDQLEASRRLHRMNEEMSLWIRQVAIFMVYLCVLLLVAHGSRSPWMHPMTSSLFKIFPDYHKEGQGDSLEVHHMEDFLGFWDWSSAVLVPGLYEDGKRKGLGANEAYTKDGESTLVGIPRVRQIRVKNGICYVTELMRPYVTLCTPRFSSNTEERETFRPGWKSMPFNTTTSADEFQTPWSYISSEETGGIGLWSFIEGDQIYPGSGYVAQVGPTRKKATIALKFLEENQWIDRSTVVLFIDFAVYNPATSLFGIVKIIIEMSAGGAMVFSPVIDTIQLYDVSTGYDVTLLLFQLLLPVIVIYCIAQEVLEMRRGIVKYFTSFFRWVELLQILCVTAWMALHIYKMIYIDKTTKLLLKDSKSLIVIDQVVLLYNIENILLAFVVFFNTLKLLIHFQFSHVKHFFLVLVHSRKDVLSYAGILFFAVGAFAQFGYIVFGSSLDDYRNVLQAFEQLCNMMIGGDPQFMDLYDHNRLLGPGFFVAFSLSSLVLFINFFVLILIHYYDVQREKHKNDYGLGRYLVDRFKEALGFGKTVVPREEMELDEIRRQCQMVRYMINSKAFQRIERKREALERECREKSTSEESIVEKQPCCTCTCVDEWISELAKETETMYLRLEDEFFTAKDDPIKDIIGKLGKVNSLLNTGYVEEFSDDIGRANLIIAASTAEHETQDDHEATCVPEIFENLVERRYKRQRAMDISRKILSFKETMLQEIAESENVDILGGEGLLPMRVTNSSQKLEGSKMECSSEDGDRLPESVLDVFKKRPQWSPACHPTRHVEDKRRTSSVVEIRETPRKKNNTAPLSPVLEEEEEEEEEEVLSCEVPGFGDKYVRSAYVTRG